jgi:hypothetical protein
VCVWGETKASSGHSIININDTRSRLRRVRSAAVPPVLAKWHAHRAIHAQRSTTPCMLASSRPRPPAALTEVVGARVADAEAQGVMAVCMQQMSPRWQFFLLKAGQCLGTVSHSG